MAEAAGAADELPEDNVAEGVAAPPFRVAALHLLRLLPALLLHAVGKSPGLRWTRPPSAVLELQREVRHALRREPRVIIEEEGGRNPGGATGEGGGRGSLFETERVEGAVAAGRRGGSPARSRLPRPHISHPIWRS